MHVTVKTQQLLQDGGAPEYVYNRTAWHCAVFVGKSSWKDRQVSKTSSEQTGGSPLTLYPPLLVVHMARLTT